MISYQVTAKQFTGTSYDEVVRKARRLFHDLERQTRRQPYLRSAYFGKRKIFLNYFWLHLDQKPKRERIHRMIFLPCAVELIRNSRNVPSSKPNPNAAKETLHRFTGLTPDKETFYVQIKEDQKTKRLSLMSVFSPEL